MTYFKILAFVGGFIGAMMSHQVAGWPGIFIFVAAYSWGCFLSDMDQRFNG
jgi:hypothetical protein